jgi:hypothetical protein
MNNKSSFFKINKNCPHRINVVFILLLSCLVIGCNRLSFSLPEQMGPMASGASSSATPEPGDPTAFISTLTSIPSSGLLPTITSTTVPTPTLEPTTTPSPTVDPVISQLTSLEQFVSTWEGNFEIVEQSDYWEIVHNNGGENSTDKRIIATTKFQNNKLKLTFQPTNFVNYSGNSEGKSISWFMAEIKYDSETQELILTNEALPIYRYNLEKDELIQLLYPMPNSWGFTDPKGNELKGIREPYRFKSEIYEYYEIFGVALDYPTLEIIHDTDGQKRRNVHIKTLVPFGGVDSKWGFPIEIVIHQQKHIIGHTVMVVYFYDHQYTSTYDDIGQLWIGSDSIQGLDHGELSRYDRIDISIMEKELTKICKPKQSIGIGTFTYPEQMFPELKEYYVDFRDSYTQVIKEFFTKKGYSCSFLEQCLGILEKQTDGVLLNEFYRAMETTTRSDIEAIVSGINGDESVLTMEIIIYNGSQLLVGLP